MSKLKLETLTIGDDGHMQYRPSLPKMGLWTLYNISVRVSCPMVW